MARVLVHSCFNPEDETYDPTACHCSRFIRNSTRDAMIANGQAFYLVVPNGANQLEADRKQIVLRNDGKPKVPRAATIEQRHIRRAYLDGNRHERARIKAYGDLTAEAWEELGAATHAR